MAKKKILRTHSFFEDEYFSAYYADGVVAGVAFVGNVVPGHRCVTMPSSVNRRYSCARCRGRGCRRGCRGRVRPVRFPRSRRSIVGPLGPVVGLYGVTILRTSVPIVGIVIRPGSPAARTSRRYCSRRCRRRRRWTFRWSLTSRQIGPEPLLRCTLNTIQNLCILK